LVPEPRPRISQIGRHAILACALAVGLLGGIAGLGAATAAPTAPRHGCIPGNTRATRIDAIIALLIGVAAPPGGAGREMGALMKNRLSGV
jgi:hypothetical protein